MLLAKSCKKNHHIAKGTLRLGSLYEYRHTEIKHIADHEEGVMRFNIRLKGPIRISNKWSNTLFGGNFVFGSGDYYKFPGSTYAKVEVLRQNHTTNSYTEFGDTSLTITREALNSFIFCMSAVSTEEEATGIFPEYDSHWYITEQKIEAFGPAIAMSLGDAIILGRSTGKHIIPEHIDLKTLTIQTEGGKVFYKDRVINISNNSKFALAELHRALSNIEFVKPPSPFSKEKEYRFKFTLHSNGKIIQPLTNSIIINSEKIISLIEL